MSKQQKPTSWPGELVVVGASAGGVEALSVLLTYLPTDFAAPIVIAQHLDPNRPSSLAEILQRRTSLTVELVETKSQIMAGKIYVVPANRNVAINDGHVEIQDYQPGRPRPSVDLLLSTASAVYGERLIAVILTGSGLDGALGAYDVKQAGGVVITQNPQTARFPSMPLAVPPTVVDFEVDVEKIGELLNQLVRGVNPTPADEKVEDILHHILEQVSRQANIDFRPYKTSTILRRIGRRMTVVHKATMPEYASYLNTHSDEVGELVRSFLINVTQFFRDPEAFAYLKNELFPQIIEKARARDKVLRLWSAGCATGEEAYSLAMLLVDLLGSELPTWSIKVFATDLDEPAISFARRGIYADNLLKGLPDDYRDRFFEHQEFGYHISKSLRQMVIFGQQDLSRSSPFPRIDLALCRNVLIYFSPELQDTVLNQFAFSLYPNGYLFLGKAETVRPAQTLYEIVNKPWKIYRCVGTAMPLARRAELGLRQQGRSQTGGAGANSRSDVESSYPGVDPSSPLIPLDLGQLRRHNDLLLRFLPIGILVIDRSYHLLTANGAARRLLGLRDLGSEQDFLHSVRGIPYSQVRLAIDSVFRERSTVVLPEVELDTSVGGNGRFLTLAIALMQSDVAMPDLAVISVNDVTDQVQIRHQLEISQSEQAQLMSELSAANQRLNDMNKELLDANEELQVANEELVLTHEELQASIEEFETTNEELQATNEELETGNEEMQATNEELETTNEELRGRSAELHESALQLESERKHLAEMVELAPFYVLVLRGPRLLVEAFNPRYARVVEGIRVQDRPLEEVYDFFWKGESSIPQLAHEVYREDAIRTRPNILALLPSTHGGPQETYFDFTLVPSHDANNRVAGVVVYASDVTEQRTRELVAEHERLRAIFDHAEQIALALYDAETGRLITSTPRYTQVVQQLSGGNSEKPEPRQWQEVYDLLPAQQMTDLWQSVLEQQQPQRLSEVHLALPTDSGEMIWDLSLTPIMNPSNPDQVRYVLLSAIEITEQVKSREEVERLNRQKDEFLSLVSHELRAPLAAIQGFAQLLQRSLRKHQGVDGSSESTETRDFERELKNLERITHQTGRMTKLLNEMSDITRMRSAQFELNKQEGVNVVRIAQRVTTQFKISTNRDVSLIAEEEGIEATLDEARIEQVLTNLVDNALKYSPADKPVVVTVRHEADCATFEVHDQGNGVAPADQQHIFDRFYRAHATESNGASGLGLGLYISQAIVLKHGGRIWVESELGKGSTFNVALPINAKAE